MFGCTVCVCMVHVWVCSNIDVYVWVPVQYVWLCVCMEGWFACAQQPAIKGISLQKLCSCV